MASPVAVAIGLAFSLSLSQHRHPGLAFRSYYGIVGYAPWWGGPGAIIDEPK